MCKASITQLLLLLSFLFGIASEVHSSTWMTFKLAHFLNSESPEGRNVENWSVQNWITWLHARHFLDEFERDGGHARHLLYKKPLDSVIVASPEALTDAFSTPPPLKRVRLNIPIDNPSKYKENNSWSKQTFTVYFIKYGTKADRHTVHRCTNLYIAGALNNDRLVHFERANPEIHENYRGNLQAEAPLNLPEYCRNIEQS